MPKARTPRTWVTVLASQPSVSMETETTQRMEPPNCPGLPTVFMTSRRKFLVGELLRLLGESPVRSTISRRNRSISSAAMSRKLSSSASPASSCSLSMSSVFGRGSGLPCLVEIAEQCQPPVFERGRAVIVLAVEAGDVVVDQLRDGRVVADDDEAGRHSNAFFFPELEGLLVVAVEASRAVCSRVGSLRGSSAIGLAAALLGHVLADVLPEVAEHRHFVAGDIVGHRDARQLDDAAFDGVHEREIAHRPREERAFGVARAAEEERRRR